MNETPRTDAFRANPQISTCKLPMVVELLNSHEELERELAVCRAVTTLCCNKDKAAVPEEQPTAWIATNERGRVLHLSQADGWKVEAVTTEPLSMPEEPARDAKDAERYRFLLRHIYFQGNPRWWLNFSGVEVTGHYPILDETLTREETIGRVIDAVRNMKPEGRGREAKLDEALKHILWVKDCGIDGAEGDGKLRNYPGEERDAMYEIAKAALDMNNSPSGAGSK